MKKKINGSDELTFVQDLSEMKDTFVLTPSALLAFLNEIEELADLDISLTEETNGLGITIGTNSYMLESQPESSIEVSEEIVDTIEEIDDEGYESLIDEGKMEEMELIEGDLVQGGIIKELIKTLAIGGLVRMTKNALLKS